MNYSNPYNPFPQTTRQSNEITCQYVQGLEAAKAFPLGPGQFAVLIDISDPVIYTKSTDQFGRPSPVKILDYTERVQNNNPLPQTVTDNFVTKNDFEEFKNEIKEMLRPRQNNYKKSREEQ